MPVARKNTLPMSRAHIMDVRSGYWSGSVQPFLGGPEHVPGQELVSEVHVLPFWVEIRVIAVSRSGRTGHRQIARTRR